MTPIFDISDTPKLRIGFLSLLCLLSVVAFGGLLEHPMNAVGDEPAAIQDAKLILDNPFNWFSDQRVMVVRPPVDLFFMMGWVLWGENDAGYQGLQVLLHIIAAWLVFCVLRKQQVDMAVSMIAAILFLLNVAHFRTVQWVICVNYVLTCIFVLIGVWFLLHYFETKKNVFLGGSIGMTGCAVFSHPAGVAIVIFFVYLLWQKKRSVQTVLVVVTGMVFVALAFLVSPNHMQVQGVVNEPDSTRILTNPIWYLGRLVTSAHWFSVLAIQNEPHPFELILGVLFCMGGGLAVCEAAKLGVHPLGNMDGCYDSAFYK